MIIYTIATIAFYLLGAGILHGMGKVPAAKDMIPVLSNIYTQTMGGWSLWLFYAGAIATLYGTIFAATAANSRVGADMLRLIGVFKADDYVSRRRYRNTLIVVLSVIPAALFFLVESPVNMVIAGGLAQAMMLPVIGLSTLYLRHRHLPKVIVPSRWVTVGLWFATAVIVWLTGYYVFEQVRKL
jgi:manganese transport protein